MKSKAFVYCKRPMALLLLSCLVLASSLSHLRASQSESSAPGSTAPSDQPQSDTKPAPCEKFSYLFSTTSEPITFRPSLTLNRGSKAAREATRELLNYSTSR